MTDQAEKKYSVFWGVVVIADTVISGDMLALPVDPADVWFFWGALILIIAWFSMLHSGLLLLETNLSCPAGSSFNTATKDLIGNTWNIISGITIAFVLYILTYAYISTNDVIISETISMNLSYHANPRIVEIYIAIFVANVSWIGPLAASHIISLFLGLRVISFVTVFNSFFFQIGYPILRNVTSTAAGTPYFPYIFMVLPMCLVSFGFHGNISSLIICYGKHKDRLIRSVVFDSLLALVVHLFWLHCTMGNIPRESFKAVVSSGGSVSSLVKSFLGTKQHGTIEFRLLVFSNLAVASSLFGVTLGLFDYLADLSEIDSSHGGRFKAMLLTFLSPALLYLIFPNGFIYGIGDAGLCATIWIVVIPAVLAIKARKKLPSQMFTVWGGNLIPMIVILSGMTVVLCWFGNIFNVLPKSG